MIKKSKEYKSEIYKIAGFALMTPAGGIFVNPLLCRELEALKFILYGFLCLMLLALGIWSLFYGYNVLVKEEKVNASK